jgi:hypothetical protein
MNCAKIKFQMKYQVVESTILYENILFISHSYINKNNLKLGFKTFHQFHGQGLFWHMVQKFTQNIILMKFSFSVDIILCNIIFHIKKISLIHVKSLKCKLKVLQTTRHVLKVEAISLIIYTFSLISILDAIIQLRKFQKTLITRSVFLMYTIYSNENDKELKTQCTHILDLKFMVVC